MNIEFRLDHIDGFLPALASQLNVEIANNSFVLPKAEGKGFFRQAIFSSGLVVVYYEMELISPGTVVRQKSNNTDILPIILWISNAGITQQLNAERKKIGKNTPNGIFFPSNNMETSYTFPAGVPIKNITIFLDKNWLRSNINPQNDFISKTIFNQTKFFLFEEITFTMEEVIVEIQDVFTNQFNHALAHLNLYANTLKLTNLFFEKLLQRSTEKVLVNIKPHDIKSLFKVKSIIADNYIDFPTMDFLAKESGMNERKLQKLFKQVFGKSIYQFALSLKIREAKRLLQSKKYSVSEVGYLVGYANLSHFTQKFKKHVGTTPKAYLQSL